MKVVVSHNNGTSKQAPLLPLTEDPELYKLDKTNSVSWDLRTVPAQADSPTYKFQVRVLQGDETAREMVRWRLDVLKVCVGLNATTLASRKPIMEASMRTGPLASFHAALQVQATQVFQAALEAAIAADAAAGNTNQQDAVNANGVAHYSHNDHLDMALGLVVTNYLPRKILAKVKRSIRRDMRKPADMKIQAYYQNLLRLNNEELPNLPPYGVDQRLSQDELLDIILFGTPRSWQNKMDRQGFDPMEKHLSEVVDFMENIKTVETAPMKEVTKKSSSSKKTDKSSTKKKSTPYYCKQHGPNYTHDTADCKFLKNQGSSSGKKFSNKTWTNKSKDSTSSSKKELAALVQKSVKAGVKAAKKQLASTEKKRKADESDDSDSDKDCFLLDTLTKDLDGFNYEAMEKLSIDDAEEGEISDEVSV